MMIRLFILAAMGSCLAGCAAAPYQALSSDAPAISQLAAQPKHRKTIAANEVGVPLKAFASSQDAPADESPASGDYQWLDRENAKLARLTTICRLCTVATPSASKQNPEH